MKEGISDYLRNCGIELEKSKRMNERRKKYVIYIVLSLFIKPLS